MAHDFGDEEKPSANPAPLNPAAPSVAPQGLSHLLGADRPTPPNRPGSSFVTRNRASEYDTTMVEFGLKGLDPTMIGDTSRLDKIREAVLSDPSFPIGSFTGEELTRRAGLTFFDEMDEVTAKRLAGESDQLEAFYRGGIDWYADTWGTAFAAGQILTDQENQRHAWTANYLDDPSTRRDIILDIQNEQLLLEGEFDSVGAWTVQQTEDITQTGLRFAETPPVDDELLERLIDKQVSWAKQGNNLAFQIRSGDKVWDVLINLKPGTEVDTNGDALRAWLSAENGLAGAVNPISDTVPGGTPFWDGFKSTVRTIEKWGASHFNLDNQLALGDIDRTLGIGPPQDTPAKSEADALREQILEKFDDTAHRANQLVGVALAQGIDPSRPVSDVFADAETGLASVLAFDPGLLERLKGSAIDTFVDAHLEEQDEQSIILDTVGDVGSKINQAITVWNTQIHYMGINMSRVGDLGELRELVDDARENGWSNAMTAWVEETAEYDSYADFAGIDEDSAWHDWINFGITVGLDPITWATMGAGASWKNLEKMVTTVGGVERIIKSRPAYRAAIGIAKKGDTDIAMGMLRGGMSDDGVAALFDVAARRPGRAGVDEVLDIMRRETPAFGGNWTPAGPGRIVQRKGDIGLGNAAKLMGEKIPGASKPFNRFGELLVRASRQRFTPIDELGSF